MDSFSYALMLGVVGLESAIFVGFLGWLLVALRRKDRRDADRDELHRQFVEYAEGAERAHASISIDRLAEIGDPFPDDLLQDLLLELVRDVDAQIPEASLVELYRREGFAQEQLEALDDDSQSVRLRALRSLIAVSRPDDMPRVREAELASNTERILALRIAIDSGTPDDVVDLLRGFELRSRIMEEPLYAVLESMEPTEFAHVVAVWNECDAPGMKRVLLRLAAHFDVDETVEKIRLAADSPHLELRTAASDASALLDDPLTLPIVTRLLEDDHPAVRARAATALGDHDPDGAIPPLRDAITDPEFWVRQNAAASLGRLGAPGLDALETIVDASHDPYAVDAARQELQRGRSPSDAGHRA